MRSFFLLLISAAALSRLTHAQVPELLEPLPLPMLAAAAPAAGSPAAASAATEEAPPPSSLLPDPSAVSSAQPTASLSQNVTINLINRLVQRGALTQADAVDLIRLAEQDAQTAQSQAQVLAETKVALEQAAPPPPRADMPPPARSAAIGVGNVVDLRPPPLARPIAPSIPVSSAGRGTSGYGNGN